MRRTRPFEQFCGLDKLIPGCRYAATLTALLLAIWPRVNPGPDGGIEEPFFEILFPDFRVMAF